ncbi:hypothetical protein AARAC_000687 [Aspergillus arachidicola]|uniref:Uncharacterized protein n=1 Tax=Aspergillus arachidicola TaxID=656916 RepID=A0A2G7FWX7_9EURO|nr:hypothetical protein AARAC_000687 [Aspergillus arachidicola]
MLDESPGTIIVIYRTRTENANSQAGVPRLPIHPTTKEFEIPTWFLLHVMVIFVRRRQFGACFFPTTAYLLQCHTSISNLGLWLVPANGRGRYYMAYNITGAHPKPLDPKHRVKTGDFRDAFAREANKRRNEAGTSKAPFSKGKRDDTKPYNERKRFSWIPYFHRTNDDEESPRDGLKKHRDQVSSLPISVT